jgi:TRAP-type uncharacterized transport system substrate-binding protein
MSNNLPSEELNTRLNHFLQNIYAPASKDGIPLSAGGEESDLLYNIVFYAVVALFIIYLYQSKIGEHVKKSVFSILNVINKSVPDEFKVENFQSLLFDTPDKEIVLKNINEKGYLILKTGYGLQGTYPEECTKLFRAKIYPTQPVATGGSIDNIIQLLNNKLDVAFVDEQILYEFVNNLNPELNSYIARQMNFSDNENIKSEEKSSNSNSDINNINFDNIAEYLNFSLIAPLYYQPFFFIAKQSTSSNPVSSIQDLKNIKTGIKTVGVIGPNGNSYYHLRKIFKINALIAGENINLVLFDTQQQMISAFKNDKIVDGKKLDVIYFTSNHKNEELLKLSEDLKLRFIDPFPASMTFLQFSEGQYLKEMPFFTFRDKGLTKISDLQGKRLFVSNNDKGKLKKVIETYEMQNNTKSDLYNSLKLISSKPNGQTYNSGEELIDLMINNQVEVLYLPTMKQRNTFLNATTDMIANDIFQFGEKLSQDDLIQSVAADIQKNNLRQIVENEMKYAFPRNINLNHFYQNINDRNGIPSYATRMCLVARNKLPIKQVYYLVDNMVKRLTLLRKNMNQYQYNRNIDNTVSDAFQLQEFVSSSDTIPIHLAAKQKYMELGLIKVKESLGTDL